MGPSRPPGAYERSRPAARDTESAHSVLSGPNLSLHVNDNVSTHPMKSILSLSTAKSSMIDTAPMHEESTLATSLAPSSSQAPVADSASVAPSTPRNVYDDASVVTLASSLRGRNRARSMDSVNALTMGIPPASIMEQALGVSPLPATPTPAPDRTSRSTYAPSTFSFSKFDDEDDHRSMHTGGHVLRGDLHLADEAKSVKS